MQLRLFRHFVPLSVVLLASSDALLITGAFYQLLSPGDRRPDRVACFKFYRSVFRGFGYRCSNRDGFGRALWTSKFRGLSSSVEQDRRHLDNRVDARLFFGHILGRGARLPAGCKKSSAEGDAYLAHLRFGNAGYFLCDVGRGLLKRRVLVLGNGAQAARIAKLVETGGNVHFIFPISFIGTPQRTFQFAFRYR